MIAVYWALQSSKGEVEKKKKKRTQFRSEIGNK